MQTGLIKGLKPILIKRLAMFIGVCYLLNPLHDQLNDVLHVISHGIEIPDYIIEHPSPEVSEHHFDDHHQHKALSENHEHLLIKTIDFIFATSNDHEGSNEKVPGQLKIDKHITSFSYQQMPFFLHKIKHLFLNPFLKIKEGYKKAKENPPRNFLS